MSDLSYRVEPYGWVVGWLIVSDNIHLCSKLLERISLFCVVLFVELSSDLCV